MYDLDDFKQITDGHGHQVGGRLLQVVAQASMRAARADELFVRLGGDEFAMVFRPQSIDGLEAATERV